MPLVTWITCHCGHETRIPFSEWDREVILPRARCSRCGARGAADLRHGHVSEANAAEGSRVQGDGPVRDG